MQTIKEVLVVEGKSDTQNLRRFFDVATIETNGSAIDSPTLAYIQKAQDEHGVIVMTDPDYPGQKIRQTIAQAVPGVKHAFIPRSDCQSPTGGSPGIEHADEKSICDALDAAHVALTDTIQRSHLSLSFLQDLGLVNGPGARLKRERLGQYLHIGYANGKQLKKRLEMFGITEDQVRSAMEEVEGETL